MTKYGVVGRPFDKSASILFVALIAGVVIAGLIYKSGREQARIEFAENVRAEATSAVEKVSLL